MPKRLSLTLVLTAALVTLVFDSSSAHAGDDSGVFAAVVLITTVPVVAVNTGFTIYDVAATPSKGAAVAEIVLATPGVLVGAGWTAVFLGNADNKAIAIAPAVLTLWSGALVYHGIDVLRSPSKKKSHQAKSRAFQFAPTMVSTTTQVAPGFGVAGVF